jgi:hypothetical protein
MVGWFDDIANSAIARSTAIQLLDSNIIPFVRRILMTIQGQVMSETPAFYEALIQRSNLIDVSSPSLIKSIQAWMH